MPPPVAADRPFKNRRRCPLRRTRLLSNDVDDGVGGVRVAAAVVLVTTAAGRQRVRGRVQGGRADDHQTGFAVRSGTVRAGRRSSLGHGQQEIPGPSQDSPEENREQV